MTNSAPDSAGSIELESPAAEPAWYALYVRSNNEKAIERQLRLKQIETFLPLVVEEKQWKNRVRARTERPMFPGYLFACLSRGQWVRALEIPQVHAIVGNGKTYLPIDRTILEVLRSGIGRGAVRPHENLRQGARAVIRSGPFTGLEGVVARLDNQLQVVLAIEQIGRSFALRVSAGELELL